MATATQEVVRTCMHPELLQPLLMVVRLLLAKHEIDKLVVAILCQAKWDHMSCYVQEVITSV